MMREEKKGRGEHTATQDSLPLAFTKFSTKNLLQCTCNQEALNNSVDMVEVLQPSPVSNF